ncbi:MAG: ParM/StbA family protein [Symploca sp. SIO2E9]|nr:ParM/StbA family protein [Symploca sp. SIO2E9]
MPRPRKRGDAIAVMDFGGYSTRVFYQSTNPSSAPDSFVMEAPVGAVSQELAKSYTDGNLSSAAPENIAWVAVGSECRAVGYLASSQFNAHIGLTGLKYEDAVYKALAAIWVISCRLQLESKFSIELAVMLPPGELNDSQQFFELLSHALKSYETPTGCLKVKLGTRQAFQEGSGICAMHCQKLGEAFSKRAIAYMMVGYRNASVLISARGAVGKGKTSDLGMVRMTELVQERTSGYNAARLTAAIAKADFNNLSRRHLLPLTRARNLEQRQKEADQLIEAIKLARSDYAGMLTRWLTEVMPPDADELVFCGGTAEYLKPELRDYFSVYPQSWHGDIEVPQQLDCHGMGIRLADAYGAFCYFSSLFAEAVESQVPIEGKEVVSV